MFLGMKMFGIVIFRYERKFEVQGLVKPGFALFEMSGVKLIMEQRTQHPQPTSTWSKSARISCEFYQPFFLLQQEQSKASLRVGSS